MKNLKYLAMGIIFGIILVKAEVVSWFRIQEMFLLQGFHMYGIMFTAVGVGGTSILLIKRFKLKTISHEPIVIPQKKFTLGTIYGGLIFGIGWSLTAACPGPMYAQLGSGFLVVSVTLLSALFGTWIYGLIHDKLPY